MSLPTAVAATLPSHPVIAPASPTNSDAAAQPAAPLDLASHLASSGVVGGDTADPLRTDSHAKELSDDSHRRLGSPSTDDLVHPTPQGTSQAFESIASDHVSSEKPSVMEMECTFTSGGNSAYLGDRGGEADMVTPNRVDARSSDTGSAISSSAENSSHVEHPTPGSSAGPKTWATAAKAAAGKPQPMPARRVSVSSMSQAVASGEEVSLPTVSFHGFERAAAPDGSVVPSPGGDKGQRRSRGSSAAAVGAPLTPLDFNVPTATSSILSTTAVASNANPDAKCPDASKTHGNDASIPSSELVDIRTNSKPPSTPLEPQQQTETLCQADSELPLIAATSSATSASDGQTAAAAEAGALQVASAAELSSAAEAAAPLPVVGAETLPATPSASPLSQSQKNDDDDGFQVVQKKNRHLNLLHKALQSPAPSGGK